MKTKAELADFLREASSDVVVPHDDMVDIFNDVGLYGRHCERVAQEHSPQFRRQPQPRDGGAVAFPKASLRGGGRPEKIAASIRLYVFHPFRIMPLDSLDRLDILDMSNLSSVRSIGFRTWTSWTGHLSL